MVLTYASDFKLQEAEIQKQANCSFTAQDLLRNPGALDRALPKPETSESMQLSTQIEQDVRNIMYLDPSTRGTVECR